MSKYVVVDLEMCKVPPNLRTKKYHWGCETIQIGAVLLNEEYEIIDEFNTYVSPEFGVISDYIEKLTGITYKNIESAPKMKEALKMFLDWMPQDVIMVAWSDNDERQFNKEIESKEISLEGLDKILGNWIDCQKLFTEKMNTGKIYRLSEALIIADIDYEEYAHDGLVDASNTALLFKKIQNQEQLKLNTYYVSIEEENSLCMSLGSLFEDLQLLGIA